ncbi:AAA family ATPase [Microlunatus elymi]|uniref:AAA family ATPase n=1 Tax=Microlunatus elymi TaxID=2596828 RepID=A0A516PTR7_9ACTN|nr:LuxR family transcriptional regulator [Microlunatus elymi]QDP94585.1 AAA family ATPase [Microlunatus elymi]
MGDVADSAIDPARFGHSDWPFCARGEEFDVITALFAEQLGAADPANVSAAGTPPTADAPTHPDTSSPTGAVVVAPAGIGKSRLLKEVQSWARRQQLRTATVIGTRAAATTPYGAMLHLVPAEARQGHTDATSWYGAVIGALRSGGDPLLLIIDDAQLLDAGSADLILHLVLEGVIRPLVAIRRGEPVPDPITALWKDGYAIRIDLQPFSTREIKELLRAALGGELSARTADLLARMVQGNVLYARELVTGAVQDGALRRIDGVWRWNEQLVLAPRLIDAVGQRLSGLSESDRQTLAMLALGEPLPPSCVERLADPEALTRLERAGLLQDDQDELRLHHPLYGEVILSQIGVMTRRRLLRRLADALEADRPASRPGEVDQEREVDQEEVDQGRGNPETLLRIASWRLEAGGEVPPQMLTAAATQANRVFDYVLGERLARAARARGAGVAASMEVARGLAGQNRYPEAERVLADNEQAVLAETDAELHQTYLSCRVRGLYLGLGRRDETAAMLERFHAAHHDPAARLTPAHVREADHQYLGYRANLDIDDGRAADVLDRVQPVFADPESSAQSRLLALETSGEALAYLGLHARAQQVQDSLRRLSQDAFTNVAAAADVASAAAEATLQQALCLTLDGQADQATAMVSAIQDALVHSPDAINRGLSALALGKCLLLQGKPAEARGPLMDAEVAFRSAEVGGSRSWALAMLAQTAALTGDMTTARRWLGQSRERALDRRVARTEEDAVAAAVWIAVLEGDATGAARIAVEGAEQLRELPMPRAGLLHLSVRVGGSASAVRRPLQELADSSECTFPGLLADHVDATAGDDAIALEHCAERFAERGLRLLAAEAAAQASVSHAASARSSAASRTAVRSQQLAAGSAGVRTPLLLDERPRWPELSRREREVARLAADGLSNAAIASRLVLSVRTVESHLYQAYAKLGVESRAELVRYLGTD